MLWILGNVFGCFLIGLLVWVFLSAGLPGLNPVTVLQVQLLVATFFSIGLFIFAASQDGRGVLSIIDDRSWNTRVFWACIIAMPLATNSGMIVLSYLIAGNFTFRMVAAPTFPHPFIAWALIFIVIFIVPIAEERFFRDWLWRKIETSGGSLKACLWTGSLFWLMHFHYLFQGTALKGGLINFLGLIPLTVLVSFLRLKVGSVRACIILHMFNNFLAIAPSHMLRLAS